MPDTWLRQDDGRASMYPNPREKDKLLLAMAAHVAQCQRWPRPDILAIAGHEHVLPSSTNPIRPFTAISIVASDSQAMGRVGEVPLRTWQSADKMKR